MNVFLFLRATFIKKKKKITRAVMKNKNMSTRTRTKYSACIIFFHFDFCFFYLASCKTIIHDSVVRIHRNVYVLWDNEWKFIGSCRTFRRIPGGRFLFFYVCQFRLFFSFLISHERRRHTKTYCVRNSRGVHCDRNNGNFLVRVFARQNIYDALKNVSFKSGAYTRGGGR